jgi:ribosomal protein L16 Arg81 hydroxylase
VSDLDFERLLHPISAESFLAEYWEKGPLHVSGRPAGYYASLLSKQRLESALFYSRPRPPDLKVVKEQVELLPDRYVTPEGDIDLNQLYKSYHEGHTLIVNALERFVPEVARFSRGLQEFLNHPVRANCYLSPAGSRGLHPHFDTHDVFVLQVEGAKTWKLYAGPELPLLGTFQPVVHEQSLGEPSQVVRLEPGDLLYVPRGVVHQAETADRSSLHMTVGVYPSQWVDLLINSLTVVAVRDPRFRRALPVGYLDRPERREEMQGSFAELLRAFASQASTEGCYGLLADRLIRQSVPVPDGHFGQVDELASIGADTLLEKRGRLKCRLIEDAGGAALQFPGNTVRGPAVFREAMLWVARSSEPFRVRALPDSLNEARKVDLARRLVRGGLLRAIPDPGGA